MNASSISRLWLCLMVGSSLLLSAVAAHAVDYNFPGAMPKVCSGSNGNYTCGPLTLGYGDTIAISGQKPATITINGAFATDTSSINAGASAADLNFVVSGAVTLGYNAVVNASISAGSVSDSQGGVKIGGSITTTSGDVTLGYQSTVAGSISSTSGTITVGQNGVVSGGVSSTKGTLNIGYAARVDGAVASNGTINLAQSAVVNNSITGSGGNVSIGYAAKVTGALTTSSGTITFAQNAVASSCVKSTSSATITLGPTTSINSVCCGGSCSTSCVVNNSTYKMPAACPGAVVSPDHYEVSLPSSSIACMPSTVTVTACSNSTSPCTNPSTSLSGATATLSTTGATLGASSVVFDSKGVATTTLSYPAASQGAVASVTLAGESTAATSPRQCCPDGAKCAVANSCSTTFNTAGFIMSASTSGSAATLPSQTAGTASSSYFLRAVQTNTSTGACTSALTGANTVNWTYQCNNPTTCSPGNLMAINGGAATAITGNPNKGVAGYTAVPMTFDGSGNAPFTFTYSDVGQVTLYASKSASGSLLSNLSGSSNAFVVKPGNLLISNIKQTALPNLVNPAAATAAGSKFITAGEAFTATVTAQTSGGVATPNFGRETAPEGVLLTPALVLPSGGATGSVSNSSIVGSSFSSGAATVSTLAYSEVGIITLSAAVADSDYLGAGKVTGTSSTNIGRFIPARFVLSSPSVTHRSGLACSPTSTFTHLGENFSLGFTLVAQNIAGATTTNYVGSFAKLDPTSASSWNLAGLGGTTSFSTTSGRLSLGTATGSWANGVAKGVVLIASATRAATPDGPFNTTFGIAPTDSDGVAMSAFDMPSTSGGKNDRVTVGSVALRFGRLRLSSAVGPADRTLPLPVTAQYWSGSTWDTNTLDSCTTVPTSAFNFGNLMRTISVADTAANAGITLASGTGLLKLTAPASGHVGTYDVALSLGSTATDASCLQTWAPGKGDAATAGANLAFLRGAWCGSSYGYDPSARATFGQQSTQQNLVYRRENY
jgi:MSHA biogenesis protein MshQ